jgi:hypothetical protein
VVGDHGTRRGRARPPSGRAPRFPEWAAPTGATPPAVDLRPLCPPVWDQGTLYACSAHAIAAAVSVARAVAGDPGFDPSRLFLYHYSLYVEDRLDLIAPALDGIAVGDALVAAHRFGLPDEAAWPYEPARTRITPPRPVRAAALQTRVGSYSVVAANDLDAIRASLAADVPVACSLLLSESFERIGQGDDSIITAPGDAEDPTEPHSVLIVGYDDAASAFWIRDSVGPGYGVDGYLRVAYEYLTGEAAAEWSYDFWRIDGVDVQDAGAPGPVGRRKGGPMENGSVGGSDGVRRAMGDLEAEIQDALQPLAALLARIVSGTAPAGGLDSTAGRPDAAGQEPWADYDSQRYDLWDATLEQTLIPEFEPLTEILGQVLAYERAQPHPREVVTATADYLRVHFAFGPGGAGAQWINADRNAGGEAPWAPDLDADASAEDVVAWMEDKAHSTVTEIARFLDDCIDWERAHEDRARQLGTLNYLHRHYLLGAGGRVHMRAR